MGTLAKANLTQVLCQTFPGLTSLTDETSCSVHNPEALASVNTPDLLQLMRMSLALGNVESGTTKSELGLGFQEIGKDTAYGLFQFLT